MSTRVELRAVNDPSCSSFRWFDPSRDRQRLCDSEQARLFSKPHPPLLPFPSLSWVIRILFPPPPSPSSTPLASSALIQAPQIRADQSGGGLR